MGDTERTRRILAALTVAAALLGGVVAADAQEAADHPRLVSVEAARCGTCHGTLVPVEEGTAVHPPVSDDCTNCHELTIGEAGTRVALMEPVPSLCVLCHDKEAEASGDVAVPHYPVTDTCLNCHDPHSSEQPRLLLAPQSELCAGCHDVDDLQEVHGDQLTVGASCAACHDPHGSENSAMLSASELHPPFADGDCATCHRQPFGDRVRLQARGEELCTACHGEMWEADDASVHAALHGEDRRAGCLSCHDPHMSAEAPLLETAVPDLCAECHEPVLTAVRADTGHAVGEDCTGCHLPHSSPAPRLLTTAAPGLCAECHDLENEDLAAAHLGADPVGLDCLACHSPHGAGHPSLLAETLHPPVLDGCDLCHDGAADSLVEDGGQELCFACHADIEDTVAEAEVPHMAMELGACTLCHNPHATPQASLVREAAGGACTACHPDQAAEEGEVIHGAIEVVGCQACHEPHGGSGETLLRASGTGLCLGCHGPGSVDVEDGVETVTLLGRFPVDADAAAAIKTLLLSADGTEGHPVVGHRVFGTPTDDELAQVETSFSGDLTCLTCHNPHKGASAGLFRWGVGSTYEACQQCHPK